ncbi:hypothetical protein [Arenimonas fontis]|uniref:Uncharacterized protein n=1 Tax=Arenimonas fontis TaxID=2608255 RepID=A0A5B2Z909_9GAMM|nr:hypothetical protein [Arenimonas fontis]KAA2283691.1 hypothetical protein F0415_12080 [Arenimonas fontis]
MFLSTMSLAAVLAVVPAVGAPAPAPSAATEVVAAAELNTLLGAVRIPFAFSERSRKASIGKNAGISASETIELEVLDGPRAGQVLEVSTTYILPQGLDANLVRPIARRIQEDIAANGQTKTIRPLQRDGFEFTLADTRMEFDGKSSRMARVVGVVNGAIVNTVIIDPTDGEAAPDLVEALATVRIDFAGLLRTRQRLDEETGRLVVDGKLRTAIGDLAEPHGVGALAALVIAYRDGEGRLHGVTQQFGFFKQGFWTQQRMGLSVSCDLSPDADRLAELRDPLSGKDGVTVVSRDSGLPLGGLQAERILARRENRDGSVSEVTHWYASDGEAAYALRIERVNGRALQRDLERQLSGLSLSCRPESGLGAPVTGDVAGR